MRMKASEVGDWLQQVAGKRDHSELMPEDYVVLRSRPAVSREMQPLSGMT